MAKPDPEPDPDPTPSVLYFTDRSRIVEGRARCMRKRYLEYHSGPSGYGIRPKKLAVPLPTGTGYHRTGELALRYMLEHQQVPSRDAFRAMVLQAVGEYLSRVSARGFLDTQDADNTRVIGEQCCLIEGLSWTMWKLLLPALHEQFAVVSVEEEDVIVLDCDCGLGDGLATYPEHEAKGCGGIGIQTRGDAGMRRRVDAALCVFDWKGDGNVHKYNWAEGFVENIQMALQVESLARLTGENVSGGVFIIGLHKGWRQADKARSDETGEWEVTAETAKIKYQQSPFCYGFYNPGDPPLEPVQWRASYSYQRWDEKKQKMVGTNLKGKGFLKTSLWQAELPDKPASYTTIEWWVEKYLEDATLAKQVKLAGPLFPPQHMVEAVKRSVVYEESRIKAGLWELWDIYERVQSFTDPEYLAALDKHFPQSWDCRKYNALCPYIPICRHDAGWENPLATGWFELRRPHHEPELQQVLARGVELPPEQDDEEQEVVG